MSAIDEGTQPQIPQRIKGVTTTPDYVDATTPAHTFQPGDIVTVTAGNFVGSLAAVVPPQGYPQWGEIKDTPQASAMVCLSFGVMAGTFIHAQHLTLHTSATALAAREVPGAVAYTVAVFNDGWDGPRLDTDGEDPGRYTLAEALVLVDAYRRSPNRWVDDRVELAAIVALETLPAPVADADTALPVIGDVVLLHDGKKGRVTARTERHGRDHWAVQLHAPGTPLHDATVLVTLDQVAGYPAFDAPGSATDHEPALVQLDREEAQQERVKEWERVMGAALEWEYAERTASAPSAPDAAAALAVLRHAVREYRESEAARTGAIPR
jgi:hypothetical protein